jgi:quercetin dioxygenase-like cupin family protein
VTLAPRHWDPGLGPLQLATLRRALEREGMVTAWWSDVPGTSVPVHAHAFPETRWMVEGYLRVTVGNEQVELGPGDPLDLPPNLPHATEVLGLGQAIYVSGTPKSGYKVDL